MLKPIVYVDLVEVSKAEAKQKLLEMLSDRASLDEVQLQSAIETLELHDVIVNDEGRYRYTVELMRRWVQNKPD